MSVRTIRLDEHSETLLQQLMESLDLSISAVFKRGLDALRVEVTEKASQSPYEIYQELDLGPVVPVPR